MTWNPNAPDTLGLEYAPTRLDTATVGSQGAAYAVAFTAEATRTLPAGGLGVAHQVTAAGDWTIELYTEASYGLAMADADGINHATFDPTADLHVHPACWSWPTDSQPYYRWVVGTPGTAENTNHVVHLSAWKAPNTGSFYAAQYGGLAIPAGQRLLALRLLNDRQIANYSDTQTTPGQPGQAGLSSVETPFADPTGGWQNGRITAEERVAGLNQRQTVTYTFRPRNVLTAGNHSTALAQWNGSGSGFGYFINSYSGPNLQMDSYHMQLTADYVPERRLAWGTGVRFGDTDASGFALVAPLGERWTGWVAPGAAPTLTAGQRYVLLLRGPKYADRTPFVARLPMLTPGPPISGYASGRVLCDTNGLPAQSLPTDSVGAPIYTGTPSSGPTFPPTSTPHADAMAWAKQGVQPLIGTSVTARQRLTIPTGGVTVSQVVIPVARPDYDHASPLVLRFYDNTTAPGVATGGAFFLTVADWEALPGAYTLGGRTIKTVRASLPSPVTLTAGTWWLQASTADAHPLTEVTPWGVLYLEAFTINAPPDAPNSFRPPAPALSPSVGGRISSAVAVVAPAAITGFALTRAPEQLVAASEACSGLWDTAVLTWNATALTAAKFWRYELERLDVEGGTWERIAHVADPAVLTFTDREARRGNATRYRIRQMRVDGGTSAWSELPAWTPVPYCCGIGLVTNAAPTVARSLFYTDVEPLRTYANVDADWLVTRPLYAGDYQQAFHPTERRGLVLETRLLVQWGTSTKGIAEWDALRDLARADIPAVAVLTERGDRLYAALAVPELTTSPQRGVQLYYATITATEITGSAPVITVDLPPADPTATAGTFHMGPHANSYLNSNFFMGFGE